jgi:hypothetical protein
MDMFNRNRCSTLTRLLCFLLALHFFNLSIDPRDPNPDSHPEDLKFNDIETITELVAEVVLKNKNTFGEHDEKDNYDGRSFSSHHFYCTTGLTTSPNCSPQILPAQKFQIRNTRIVQSLFGNVTIPPPKRSLA